jgi:molybdate transport system ATP-binding protein
VVDGHGVRTADGVCVQGVMEDAVPKGNHAVAVFSPSAVAVHRDVPGGSPRNHLTVTITELEPRGELVRVRADELSADITTTSAADLALVPGDEVTFVVKASEVAIYPR